MDRKEFINRLFERARQLDPAAKCEAVWGATSEFEVERAKGERVAYNVSDGGGLGFRVLSGGRMGYASTQILDEEAIELLAAGALENAALVESEDRQFMFPGSDSYPELVTWSPALEEVSAADKLALVERLEQLTLAQDERIDQAMASIFSMGGETAMVNTEGLDVAMKSNVLGGYVEAVAREGEKVNTGFKMFFTMDPEQIDLEKVARAAAHEAVSGLDAVQAPSGSYRVLLRSDVAATLLSTFSGVFSADNAQRGLSRLKGREGEAIASGCVTLLDNPHLAGSAASAPFDGEGVATYEKAVIEDGRLNTLLHNLKTAHKQGVGTTANGSRPGYAAPVGVAPSNFYFKPTDVSFDGMLEKLGDGLLVTEMQGMHAGANPITGDFSLAAKGIMVRGGRMAEAVAQITIAGNFYELLGGIEAVGGDLEFLAPGGSCFGSPSLIVEKLSVAGK